MGKIAFGRIAGAVVALSCLVFVLNLGLAQTYVFQRAADVRTLDPLGAREDLSLGVIENVYERLYDFKGATLELEPRLATSYEVSDDGLTYTFHLRGGVTFHSGNPFTCADVEYSFKRVLANDPGALAEAVFGPDVEGAYVFDETTPEEEYADYWAAIERSVGCLDDRTFTVRTLDADPILLARLTVRDYSVIDAELAKANGLWDGTEATWRDWIHEDLKDHYLHDHMSGTGPFRLKSWEPGVRLVAERYANYWGPAPAVATVVYEVVEDDDARVAAILAGEADQVDYPVGAARLAEVAGKPGVKVLDPSADATLPWGMTSVWAILFNQRMATANNPYIGSGALDGAGTPHDLFTDSDMRKCVAYSFDPVAYDEEKWQGSSLRLTMALLPEFDGYDPTIPQYGFDREKAEQHCRAAWGGAVWEKGFRLILPYVAVQPVAAPVVRQLKANLEALNPKFAIELQEVDWDDYFDASDALELPLDVVGSPLSLPDAAGFMDTWYRSEVSWAGYYGYRNDEVDRLIEGARTEFDADKRAEAYRRVGRLGYEDAAFVLIPNGPVVLVTSDKVAGVYRNPVRVGINWADLVKLPWPAHRSRAGRDLALNAARAPGTAERSSTVPARYGGGRRGRSHGGACWLGRSQRSCSAPPSSRRSPARRRTAPDAAPGSRVPPSMPRSGRVRGGGSVSCGPSTRGGVRSRWL